MILVVFAIVLPLVLLMSAVVVDVGNWYVHKKRLQTLVDAGAFAGATKFVGCSFQFGDPDAANEAIRSTALGYSGDTARAPGTLNVQEQEPDDVRVVLNSKRYWADSDPMDGIGLDNTLDHDGNPMTPGDPCSSKTLDVKATDDDAPLLFGFIPFVADPKSKARVEIRQVKEQAGMLPWAVPEIDPAAVAAIFVDEDDGAVLDWQSLGQFDDETLPFSEWSTYAGQEDVFIGSDNIGVVILVSKEDATPSLTGTLADICTQAPNLVACYGGSSNTSGLTFIHGFSGIAGAPHDPQIRDVNVQDLTCATDDDSAPYFLLTGDCDVGVRAIIDFGFAGDPTPARADGGIAAQVVLHAPGCRNQGCAMTYDSQSIDGESIWFTTEVATLPASDSNNNGRQNFSIEWSTRADDPATPDPAAVVHTGTFSGVAHPYVANAASGPVLYLKLTATKYDPLNDVWLPVYDANSLNKGNTYKYVVTVGLTKPLQIRDPFSDPVLLRHASPSGSLNQALDCDSGITFTQEIIDGCQTTYGLNFDDFDKDGDKEWADITCSAYPSPSDLPPATFYPVPPEPVPNCVAAKTGDVIAFTKGLKARFEEPTCTPNNWPEDQNPPGRGPEDDEVLREFFMNHDFANDPRYVTLIITDITAFEGSGSTNLPIKYFAGFYATGWDVSPQTTGCPGENDPHPLFGTGYRRSKDNGDVWGHFVNIVIFSASGLPNDPLCNFDEVGTCIAVLVE